MHPPGSFGVTGQGEGHKMVGFEVLCRCMSSVNTVPCKDQVIGKFKSLKTNGHT